MNVAAFAGANSAILAANIAAMSAKRRRIGHRRALLRRINKRERNIMSNELIKEFIGKEVHIVTVDSAEYRGRLVACEDNWVKIEEKRNTRLINTDIITAISYKTLNL